MAETSRFRAIAPVGLDRSASQMVQQRPRSRFARNRPRSKSGPARPTVAGRAGTDRIAPGRALSSRGRLGQAGMDRLVDLVATAACSGTDRRDTVDRCRSAQRRDALLDHPGSESAPSCVNRPPISSERPTRTGTQSAVTIPTAAPETRVTIASAETPAAVASVSRIEFDRAMDLLRNAALRCSRAAVEAVLDPERIEQRIRQRPIDRRVHSPTSSGPRSAIHSIRSSGSGVSKESRRPVIG